MVQAHGIIHPVGDAAMSPEKEVELRRSIVRTALEALQTDVEQSTLFN
jgi:hypothetical protein